MELTLPFSERMTALNMVLLFKLCNMEVLENLKSVLFLQHLEIMLIIQINFKLSDIQVFICQFKWKMLIDQSLKVLVANITSKDLIWLKPPIKFTVFHHSLLPHLLNVLLSMLMFKLKIYIQLSLKPTTLIN